MARRDRRYSALFLGPKIHDKHIIQQRLDQPTKSFVLGMIKVGIAILLAIEGKDEPVGATFVQALRTVIHAPLIPLDFGNLGLKRTELFFDLGDHVFGGRFLELKCHDMTKDRFGSRSISSHGERAEGEEYREDGQEFHDSLEKRFVRGRLSLLEAGWKRKRLAGGVYMIGELNRELQLGEESSIEFAGMEFSRLLSDERATLKAPRVVVTDYQDAVTKGYETVSAARGQINPLAGAGGFLGGFKDFGYHHVYFQGGEA